MNEKVFARPTLVEALMKANGEEVRAARERLNISQGELAERAGTNQQTIDKIERGLTRQSKYVPEIRQALGLPMVPPSIAESLLRFADIYEGGGSPPRIGIRARLPAVEGSQGRIPVFALIREKGVDVISAEPALLLPRAYPVDDVDTAYGVIVPDDQMEPVLKKGEIAVVNPDASPTWGGEVFILRALADDRNAGILRSWVGFENTSSRDVRVRSWNPPKEEVLNGYFWPAMGAVVAKLPPPPRK